MLCSLRFYFSFYSVHSSYSSHSCSFISSYFSLCFSCFSLHNIIVITGYKDLSTLVHIVRALDSYCPSVKLTPMHRTLLATPLPLSRFLHSSSVSFFLTPILLTLLSCCAKALAHPAAVGAPPAHSTHTRLGNKNKYNKNTK